MAAVTIAASAALLYQSEKTLFPEKLGDMELKLHREGDVAIREIKGSHSAKDNINPEEAHIARYRNSAGSRATVSVTLAETNQRAVEKVENMNRGMGGMFSTPKIVEINDLKIYYTEGGGEYHYYYAKNDFVVWIALSNSDKLYQSKLMNEAIKNIGG
ncbi:hypothetical protein [Candidatus Methanoperedens nitratireducens]|uniref:hypothetical protein n=1 Tax=Candidatus Methanoperedens nitratireducens TaxID=1392998 RepID=UPI001178647E|nr:hypothetical protein [Candidatus Methanoperedens nitroreducens]